MAEILQIEEVRIIRDLDDSPKLLIEWTPRWENFVTSIGPAFARSGPRLAGEAPLGGLPYRSLSASVILQSLLLFALIALPRQIDRLRPYAAPQLRPDEVIYYSGDELPRTEDLSGAQSGRSARAGGQEAHHRTQTIRIARGDSLSDKVVDAPNLKLPSSAEAVANLLAVKSRPALPAPPEPPSTKGLHSSLTAPSLSVNVVAPAPVDVANESARRGLSLNSVVAPAPAIAANSHRETPALNSSIVPPAPAIASDHRLIAPALDSTIVAPAPSISREHPLIAPSLSSYAVAPAPANVSGHQSRSRPTLNASIIPPAPATAGHEVPTTRVQMTNIAVVPPPVSAPERDAVRAAKLPLPAPSVVAPPPSADSAHDLRRLESGVASSSAVVPPPQTAAPSFMSNIIGKIFGTQDVVPPPPSVSSSNRTSSGALAANVVPPPPNVSSTNRNPAGTLSANVVPPAPSASSVMGGTSRISPRAPGASIVAPPPSLEVADKSGTTATGTAAGTSRPKLAANVIPPPASVTADSASGANRNAIASRPVGNVVPPPPSMGSASAFSGAGKRAPSDGALGSALAPPKDAAVNRDSSGIVASAQPGSNVAVPSNSGKNALAMSPSGHDKPGLGGSGSGTGIGHGEGTGSGLTAAATAPKPEENSGAGKIGAGRGADVSAHNGISSTPGPGGAGNIPTGSPTVPGVDVRGGSTIVTLPSFGSDGGDPNLPGRSSVKTAQGPAITVVATSRSGGAFDFYGELPGDNYTVYVDTALGTVVMQFAEANPSSRGQAETLTGPEAIRSDLPANLPRARMVVKCTVGASGNVRNIQVLEPGPAAMTARIVAALPGWKFRPAMRGAQPVEINAILGFNIDTHDRY